MKRFTAVMVVAAMAACASASGVSYSNDFDVETLGTLPDGWSILTPWGDWAPGPVMAEVAEAPGGGQALKVVWGTDWQQYGASSGELDFNLDIGAIPPGEAILTVSYDFYKQNWRVWQIFDAGPAGTGIHMNDDPAKPNQGSVGTTDYNAGTLLTDIPENEWVNVAMTFDAATGAWEGTVSYASGSGGGMFSGTADPADVTGLYRFGGWAFQSTMDAAPVPPGGEYENFVYVDNFSMTVIPEPAALLLVGLGGLFLRRR